jgi:hypothetical protein
MSNEACMKLQILPYNHANLNSRSRMSRQIRILGNLSDFSKPGLAPNKFGSNLKAVFFPRILIQILF